MKNFRLFLLGFLKSTPVLLTMMLLVLISCFSFGYTALKEDRPCAIYDADGSPASQEVIGYLETREFEVCQTQDALLEELHRGNADCGIILKEGFSDNVLSGEMEHCAELLVTSRTSRDNTFTMLALVGIYRVYAPYLAAEIAAEQDLPADVEAIRSAYASYVGTVPKLEFDVVTVSGAIAENLPDIRFPLAMIAISLMVAFGFLTLGTIRRSVESLRFRLTPGTLLFRGLLPQTIALSICLFGAVALGAFLGSIQFEVPLKTLLPGLLGYSLTLSWFLALLLWRIRSTHLLSSFLALDAAISLFLCPAYWDIAAYAPFLSPLRILSVPYWLYVFIGHPVAIL